MKLVGVLMEYNEESRGNLRRCLDNLSRYCDDIVVYDDGSKDDSVKVAREYTDHVIEGGRNDFLAETTHRDQMLQKAKALGADYVFWLDADEVLDRAGTEGELRKLCESGISYSFQGVTIWRSTTWRRTDYCTTLFFKRLWKTNEALYIDHRPGLHNQLWPVGLAKVRQCGLQILHYGYATQEAIERRMVERFALKRPEPMKCVDESAMTLEHIPLDWFPPGITPPKAEPQPAPIIYPPHIIACATPST